MKNVLTCVYCGMEYPAGTPASGSDVEALTKYIKVCEKHSLREAEEKIIKLRTALIGLVGVKSPDELRMMEATMRALPVPESDKVVSLNAIHALLETS